jgi:hypothetical protein
MLTRANIGDVAFPVLEFNQKPSIPLGRKSPKRHYRPRGRRFRHGRCAAAVRALTGAKLLLKGEMPNLVMAAEATGSNPGYIAFMIIVLQSEDHVLLHDVLAGMISLHKAAKWAKPVADLVVAHRRANASELARYGRAVGTAELWDETIVPNL